MCARLCDLCTGQPLSSPDRFACGGVALPLAQRNHHLTPPFVALKECFLGHGRVGHPMEPTRSLSQLQALVREALHEVPGFRHSSRHLRLPKGVASEANRRRHPQEPADDPGSRCPKPMITRLRIRRAAARHIFQTDTEASLKTPLSLHLLAQAFLCEDEEHRWWRCSSWDRLRVGFGFQDSPVADLHRFQCFRTRLTCRISHDPSRIKTRPYCCTTPRQWKPEILGHSN